MAFLIVKFATLTLEIDEDTVEFSKLRYLTDDKLAEYVLENHLFDQDLRAGALEIESVELMEPVTGVDYGRD